ncbi:MAG: LysR family transcriptional regulator [Desulfurococcales archaeon]|nr:LysR family transcriptional regulator [Desulfurococcales archaeon]
MASIKARYQIVIEVDGVEAVDEELALILEEVEARGSILAASRATGIPYSRAWEKLVKAERLIGSRLIEARRGGARGGGARLTRLGSEVLNTYREARSRLEKALGPRAPRSSGYSGAGIVIAHSSDPLIELAIERMGGVESICIGSHRALAMLSLGEADAACIHLLHPELGEYNTPYLRLYNVDDPTLLGGYMREMVLAHRPGLAVGSLDEALAGLARGRYTIANRSKGSGTRLLLDHLLDGLGADKGLVKGYDMEIHTHEETARLVALERADMAIMPRWVAERFGLPWLHVTWERYECYSARGSSPRVYRLREVLESPWFKELLQNAPGYAVLTG